MSDQFLSESDAQVFRTSIQQLQRDIADGLYTDTFACWEVNRDAGWPDSTDVEVQALVDEGTGKLHAQGAGGPQTGEMVIHVESPFVFRTWASADIETGNLLVINGTRLFRVDLAKREGTDNLLMNVYLTELFTTPMPAGGV